MAGSGANADTVNYDTALAPPGYYNGSGNANAGFTTNTTPSGVELGLGVNLPFLGVVHPTSTNIYNMPMGISTGTAATSNRVFCKSRSQRFAGRRYLFSADSLKHSQRAVEAFNPGSVGDNATNGTVGFQNAENLGFAFVSFFFPLFGFDPNAIDTYVVTLSAQNNAGGSSGLGERDHPRRCDSASSRFATICWWPRRDGSACTTQKAESDRRLTQLSSTLGKTAAFGGLSLFGDTLDPVEVTPRVCP